jgi:hypothetical protein
MVFTMELARWPSQIRGHHLYLVGIDQLIKIYSLISQFFQFCDYKGNCSIIIVKIW